MKKHAGCVNNATLYYIEDIRKVAVDLAFLSMLMVLYVTVKDACPRS